MSSEYLVLESKGMRGGGEKRLAPSAWPVRLRKATLAVLLSPLAWPIASWSAENLISNRAQDPRRSRRGMNPQTWMPMLLLKPLLHR